MVNLLRSRVLACLCIGAMLALSPLTISIEAQQASRGSERSRGAKNAIKSIEEDLTLERIFPDRSPFGPSAGSTAFSHDGRFAAYLYRPNIERRHGNDLWLFDSQSGRVERLTSVSVMEPFQASTRRVADDRRERAKKAGKDKEVQGEDRSATSATPDNPLLGNWSGRVEGEAMPAGVEISLRISVDADVLVARLTSPLFDLTSKSVSHDPSTEDVTIEFEGSRGDRSMQGAFSGRIDAENLTGTLALSPLGWELQLTASRDSQEGVQAGRESDKVSDDLQQAVRNLADIVLDDDADQRGPRYAGISSFEWSPIANEMIFISQGDLYRLDVESREIERLTMTRDSLRDVQYLPDGSGYTYLRGGALIRVSFGSHTMVQLDPNLPSGQTMTGYRISPDGKRLVFLANSGRGYFAGARTVSIISYRNRFAEVREVTRHVSDDERPDLETFVYLYELDPDLAEKTEPKMVYTRKQSGPRDIMIVPDWAPDSSRVAFSVFDQATSQIEILEARFVEIKQQKAESDEEDSKTPVYEAERARPVYRFFHNGGPNTPRMVVPTYLPDSRRMVFLTELSGFRQLHTLDPTYEQLEQLTSGRFEVYPVNVSPDHTSMLVLSTQGDPTQQNVFHVNLESGEMTRVSPVDGYYDNAAMSPCGKHYLATYVDFGSLRELVTFNKGDDQFVALTDSHTDEARAITTPMPEYFTYQNRHGQTLYGHMFLPPGYDKSQQRPLLIYVYGGPLGTRKMTSRGDFSAPSYFFAYYMAMKHGYITATIDPRGASGFGGVFEKANFEQVGVPQTEDLVDGANWFVEHYNADPKRLSMHGWSFGGFQTQMVMYTDPDVFAAGIAGAGPTEWENYNSWYSTGTIGNSRIGNPDLQAFSLLPVAKNLTGQLLLVHGVEDANVLYQDTIRVYRELLKAGKEAQVELFIDPTGGHGLGGDVKTINRYRKYESFLLRTIGRFETAEAEAESGDASVESIERAQEDAALESQNIEELIP